MPTPIERVHSSSGAPHSLEVNERNTECATKVLLFQLLGVMVGRMRRD